jgi:hypothetical protein
MTEAPDFPMFAIIDAEKYVVGYGFGNLEQVKSMVDNKIYEKNNGFDFIEMTIENGMASAGMKYKDNKFYYE